MNYNLITLLGPTAVGKTRLAARLAYEINGEIISADSRQVYRGMNIGTGKDLQDYIVNDKLISCHLIDVIDPTEEFNLFLFNKYFYDAFADITGRNKIPFLVGGTGLYLHSILKKYELNEIDFNTDQYNNLDRVPLKILTEKLKKLNPSLHNTTDLLVKDRVIKAILIAEDKSYNTFGNIVPAKSLTLGVKIEKEALKKAVTERLKHRLSEGMIEEVENLIRQGVSYEKLNFFGLEYKFIGLFLKGELNYNDMFQKLNSSIHNFAKRQMTWFRKMEGEGIKIHWLDGPDYDGALNLLKDKFFSLH